MRKHYQRGPLSGQRFGRLVVLDYARTPHPTREGYYIYQARVRCDCGTEKVVRPQHLRNGSTRSCGCWRREWARPHKGQRTGMHHHPLYRVWAGIVRRCENPNEKSYPYYGGKGIKLCDEWRKHPKSFIDWAIEQGWTEENRLTVERIGADGDYSPQSCELITRAENTRRAACRYWQRRHQSAGHSSS